jgi:hypothetical protein
MKTVATTALAYLGSSLLALLIAASAMYLIHVWGHGHLVGIVVVYMLLLTGLHLLLVVPILIAVHVVVRRSCVHVRLPLVAIPSGAIGLVGLFHVYHMVSLGSRSAGAFLHALSILTALAIIPMFSVSLGAMAGLLPFVSADFKAQRKYRVFSIATSPAAFLFVLTITLFLLRFAHFKKIEKLEGVKYVSLREHEGATEIALRLCHGIKDFNAKMPSRSVPESGVA